MGGLPGWYRTRPREPKRTSCSITRVVVKWQGSAWDSDPSLPEELQRLVPCEGCNLCNLLTVSFSTRPRNHADSRVAEKHSKEKLQK